MRTISNASERLITQIEGMSPSLIRQMREMQGDSIICGVRNCDVDEGLTACGGCKLQRYCGKDHQKADWKYHKHICNKGLVEVE